jgi:NADH oxidase (H2O2-forming)
MGRKIVIIGGGAAGIDVLELVLRWCRAPSGEAPELTLIKKEPEGFFSTCGLPFALEGHFPMTALELFKPEYYREQGVDFRTGTEATRINVDEQTVHLTTGAELPFDELVIATGSKPFIPPLRGTELKGVFTLWSREDGERLKAAMAAEGTRNAVVIGGGLIGLQTAVAFATKGLKTTVVEMAPQLLPAILDPDMASIVQKRVRTDIAVLLGQQVSALQGEDWVESVLVGAEELPADIVLIAAGMRPNVELARQAGIEIGTRGGIVVDQSMRVKNGQSFLRNVYALGDCIEVIDFVSRQPRLSQLASTALIQARVIANNLLGIGASCEHECIYGPCLSPTVSTIAGLQVGSVGVTSAIARRYGIAIKAGMAIKYTRARYFPSRKLIIAKLLFAADTEKLIGAQLVSEETVAERINELTLTIKASVTATDLVMRERCFEPSLAMVEDVLVDAAVKAIKREK